jgi:hypothetical protein
MLEQLGRYWWLLALQGAFAVLFGPVRAVQVRVKAPSP